MPAASKVFPLSLLLSGLTLLTASCGTQAAPPDSVLQSSQQRPLSVPLVNEQITLTIAEKMKDKCSELFSAIEDDKKSCGQAADALAEELDFNYIRRPDGQSAFVFLNRNLERLLSEAATADYLNELQRMSLDAIYLNKKFNLWNFTLKFSNGNADKALERIAVLFQDGAETAAQKKFLLVNQHPLAFVLGQTLDLLEEGLNRKAISAYPESLQSQRTALYHYYVPRFLAHRLNNARKTGAAMAIRLPFLFNSVYELRQIQKSQNPHLPKAHQPVAVSASDDARTKALVDKWNRFDALYSDLIDHLSAPLTPFNPSGQQDNIQDLFLGYAGARHGAGLNSGLSDVQFGALFAADPISLLKTNY